MAIEIRETIVTPDADGLFVQLHISDAAPDDLAATFRLILRSKLPPPKTTPALAQLQRAALTNARAEIGRLFQSLGHQLNDANLDLDL